MYKLTKEDNFQQFLADNNLLIVDFYADWCGPCKMLAPTLESVADSLDKEKIIKVNVDDHAALASEYEVKTIPSILFFKDGKLIERFAGYKSKSQIMTIIERVKQ